MINIQYEDLVMLRFSTTKMSMLYNLLSVEKAQMFVFDAILDKNTVRTVSADEYSGQQPRQTWHRKIQMTKTWYCQDFYLL